MAAANLGPESDRIVSSLLSILPRVHAHLPVELLREGLVVFSTLDDSSPELGLSEPVADLAAVQPHPHSGFTLQVLSDGSLRLVPAAHRGLTLSNGLVYEFTHPRSEEWVIGQARLPVFNPSDDQVSPFAAPYFSGLESALRQYAVDMVQECSCMILKQGWLDDSRWFWRQRPEIQVRRSLEQYLRSRLRGAIVEVEHIVDEDKEVDILVYWNLSAQVALIECKWMGVSFSEADESGRRRRTIFRTPDARSGLEQLADYLDRKRPRSTGRTLRGHLVVVDGRRAATGSPDSLGTPTQEQLLQYEYSAIEWQPELLSRADIAPPSRMFCRPSLTA